MFGHHHHHGGDRRRRWEAMQELAGRGGFEGRGGWGGGWDREGRGGGWGGGRGGGRGARALDQGDLKLIILDLVADKPRHGYEIIKAVEELTGGAYSPSPGVVYPTLTLLEETGLIASEAQGAKKLYSLTEEGRAEYERDAADAIAAARARLQEVRDRMGPPPAAEIGRAMKNLGLALQVRFSRGALSKEELRAVVDAIDAAARAVEQS